MTTVVPAYGRDYKSIAAVKKAIADRHDFLISDVSHPADGKPCTPAEDLAGQSVKFRYSKQRKVTVINL